MNEITDNFLLAGDKFVLKGFKAARIIMLIVLADRLIKAKKEFKNSKKQVIQNAFIKTN